MMKLLYLVAVTTGFGVVENNAKLRMGESIVVFGAGGIGLNIIQAANLLNAFPIIAVDLYDERLDLAKNFGATHLINSYKDDFESKIEEIAPKLDVFVDNTGKKK